LAVYIIAPVMHGHSNIRLKTAQQATVLSYRGVAYLLYMLYFMMSCVYCC